MNLKLKNPNDKRYNLDEYLSILQMEDKWYSFYPHFVSQKAGHSDTINEKVDLCEEIFNIPIHDSKLPHVSLLTPTFNRKIFLELMISNIQNFSYPKEKIEFNNYISLYKKLEKELHEKRKEMASIIEVANTAYEDRDKANDYI